MDVIVKNRLVLATSRHTGAGKGAEQQVESDFMASFERCVLILNSFSKGVS